MPHIYAMLTIFSGKQGREKLKCNIEEFMRENSIPSTPKLLFKFYLKSTKLKYRSIKKQNKSQLKHVGRY